MRQWRNIVSRLCQATACVVGLTVAIYVVFIHPNDARVSAWEMLQFDAKHRSFIRGARLLSGTMEHHINRPMADVTRVRQQLMATLPDYAKASSPRFTSPYQVYLPLGSYPLKLDARDGVFIPSGATLTVSPKLQGEVSMRFAVSAPHSGGVLVYGPSSERAKQQVKLERPPRFRLDANSPFYKGFWRFFSADPQHVLETWREVVQTLQLQTHDQVDFSCSEASFGCIVTDVTFYVPSQIRPKNVLIIVVDTLRADAVRAGNAPAMEELANHSLEFTHALAAGNMTSPSTNAMLSCRRPSQIPEVAFSYGVSNAARDKYYRSHDGSFPERFRQAGYDTAMIGNISVISESYGVGVSHGFSREVSLETDGYDTPMIAREAAAWLDQQADHPFLLYLHFNAPHAPYRAPFKDIFATFPGFRKLRSYPDILRWLYQGEVRYTDRYLGEVIATLKTLGLEDQTLIVLTADHGDQHTQHQFVGNQVGPEFAGAYFDHGATLLDDEVRVPLMMRVPAVAAKRIGDIVSTLDLGPTLLNFAGDLSQRDCAGTSLVPYFTGEATASLQDRTLGIEGFRGRSVVFGQRYKYIRSYEATDKKVYDQGRWTGDRTLYLVPEQLFDLVADPMELTNLAVDSAAESALLLAQGQKRYRDLFQIDTSYELIVEAQQQQQAVNVRIPGNAQVNIEEGHGEVSVRPGYVEVIGVGARRYLFEIRGVLYSPPQVRLDGQLMTLKMTSMRLPLGVPLSQLAAEQSGRFTLLDPSRESAAYLRKVEDDGQKNRRMMTGNPSFEKVLREWGYLNDK